MTSRPAQGADAPPPSTGPVDDAGDLLPLGDPRPRRRAPRDRRPLSVTAEALIAAGVVLLLAPPTGTVQRLATLRDDDGVFLALVLVSALLAGLCAAGVHRLISGQRGWPVSAVGVAAAVVAGTAWSGGFVTAALPAMLPTGSVLGAALLSSTVAAVRLDGTRRLVAGVVAGLALVLTTLGVAQAADYFFEPFADASESSAVETTTYPVTRPTPPPVAEAGPTVGDLCHPDELSMSTTRPELGMNHAYTTVTVTNDGDRRCEVEGHPTVTLIGGPDQADLALYVHVSEVDPATNEHVDTEPVALEPGTSAETHVWWPTWGSAADLESPQELRIGVAGGQEVLDLPPEDRWDVVQSAEAWVGPWRAASGE